MDIAILAPSSVPFTIGGAEGLCWSLQHFINGNTAHKAELIKLPTREGNFWDLMESYRAFSELNLDHFDLVISTKYPAWMVAHRRHVCYMLHKLRGLYDTYPGMGLPLEPGILPRELELLRTFIRTHSEDRAQLATFFDELFALRGNSRFETALAFPGPLAREIVHYLDSVALSRSAISQYLAISKNVANRADYFPAGASVAVYYPPSNLHGLSCASFDYLFTVSRLDAPKRISLIVKAMQFVRSNIKLKIAGSGPQMEHLKELAKDDQRIEFVGFVNDRNLVQHYASSLAVLFVPRDEDYGLVTIEAMTCAKPVITVADAGGPLEFVEHNVNGLISDPTPGSLAQCIDKLARHPELAQEMGKRARARVAGITWQPLVASLTDDAGGRGSLISGKKPRGRKQMVVAVTYPVYPPRGGGQVRMFNLYRELGRYFDITLVTFAPYGQPELDQVIAPNLREVRIPMTKDHQAADAAWSRKVGWIPVTDVTMPLLSHLTPGFRDALHTYGANVDIAVAAHPYLYAAIASLGASALWYEAHNAEVGLKRQILPNSKPGRHLLNIVEQVERECWLNADLRIACTKDDADDLNEAYGRPAGDIAIVPNGVNFPDERGMSDTDRRALRARLGFEGRYIALFMGSWHGPNINACEHLLEIATKVPDVDFLIVGSVCSALPEYQLPANVTLLGCLDDCLKNLVLAAGDIGLNPMEKGSGSNLKMLDYLAAGLPVIATPFGSRGLKLPQDVITTVEISKFAEAIAEGIIRIDLSRTAVRDTVPFLEKTYSWTSIARTFIETFPQISSSSGSSQRASQDVS